MSRRVATLAFLSCLIGSGYAADRVELTNGKTLRGNLAGRQSVYVNLSRIEGASEVVMRLKPNEIARIHFTDSQERDSLLERFPSGDGFQTTLLLEKLVRYRLPYLDLLSHSDELLFAMLLESYIQSGRATEALDRAKLWRTKLRDGKVIDQIDELQILAAKSAGDLDEASFYSKRWIESGKSALETALPWSTLAEQALSEGRTEDALWLSLNPIVFTHPNSPRFLENAYEIAIFSAFQLQKYEYARQLHSEMALRKLNWPIDSERASVLAKLESMPKVESSNRSKNLSASSRSSTSLFKVVGKP